MNRSYFATLCLMGLSSAVSGADSASDVRAVFSAKCARCHGPDVAKPRAGFGHILDLRRLAADPKKIVRFKPDESDLWQQVANDEMPPPDSPTGALTAQQKETIRKWIAEGAPPEREKEPSAVEAPEAPARPFFLHALSWLGKFHLLVLHFPIALMLAALAGETWSWWKRSTVPSTEVRFCLALAATSAMSTMVLGWLFALGRSSASGLLGLHRWLGTLAAGCAIALAVASELDARRGVRTKTTRGLMLAGVLLVSITAHFGGLMIHGKDFFDW
jgi:mono/diheme cytochrome c family protein